MFNDLFPPQAVLARSKDMVNRSAAALLILRLEAPSLGLISICDTLTCARFKKEAEELMVNVGEVPGLTFLGATLMG
jgi:hypothetical protein